MWGMKLCEGIVAGDKTGGLDGGFRVSGVKRRRDCWLRKGKS